MVVRDWRGEFVGALSAPVSLSQSVADLEALACRKAVEFAAELGLQKVIFEGDSAMVISALNQDNAALSSFGVVIEDIRSQVLVFQSFAFNYVDRSCNCVDDSLAQKAKGFRGAWVWLDFPPEDIVPLLMFIELCFCSLIKAQAYCLVSPKKKKKSLGDEFQIFICIFIIKIKFGERGGRGPLEICYIHSCFHNKFHNYLIIRLS